MLSGIGDQAGSTHLEGSASADTDLKSVNEWEDIFYYQENWAEFITSHLSQIKKFMVEPRKKTLVNPLTKSRRSIEIQNSMQIVRKIRKF